MASRKVNYDGIKKIPEDNVRQILDLFSSGKISEAVDFINTALKNYPQEPILFNILGACNAELGNFSKAIKNYESAISLDNNYAKAYYNLAGTLQDTKQFDKAIEAYKKAIDIEPENLDALYNLGNVLRDINEPQQAIQYFQQAVSINPNFLNSLYGLAKSYQDLDLLNDAIETYKKLLILKPDFYELYNNIAILLFKLDKKQAAETFLIKAISINPKYAEAHHNLGQVYKDMGMLDKALNCFKSALEIDPRDYKSLCSMGYVEIQRENYDSAITLCNKALKIKPDYLEALNSLGVLYRNLDNFDASIVSLKKAISLNPNYKEALNNIGLTLISQEKFNEAISHFEQVLKLDQNYVFALNNIGIAFQRLENFIEAEKFFRKAIKLDFNFYDAFVNLGNLMFYLNRYNEALENYNQANILDSNQDYILGDIFICKMYLCQWDTWSNDLKEIITKIHQNKKVINPFVLTALTDDSEAIHKAAKTYASEKFPKSNILPSIAKYQFHKKIRVGYFSADFREHPVSLLTAELYELHDRNQFEVYGFSFGPKTNDEWYLRIQQGVDHFYEMRLMSNIEIASFVRSLEIDIAVDLGGFNESARTEIFAISVAPIQLGYLGYLGTMGASYYDYLVADLMIIPKKNQKYYSEKIIYLPSFQINDSNQLNTIPNLSRKDFQLPDDDFVFCCFNNSYKITPECFDSWSRILKKITKSVLIIFLDNPIAKENLVKEMEKRGLEPERIIFGNRLDRPEYLARYKIVDLFLDTHPYNAGATASDALRMGLPVLTLLGDSFSSRMGASILNSINMAELITHSKKEYESLAIELASKPNKLRNIKEKLNQNMDSSILFDSKLFTKYLEMGYKEIYKRNQRNMQPDHIHIESLV